MLCALCLIGSSRVSVRSVDPVDEAQYQEEYEAQFQEPDPQEQYQQFLDFQQFQQLQHSQPAFAGMQPLPCGLV